MESSDSNSSSNMTGGPKTGRLLAIVACVILGVAGGIIVWIADPNAALESTGAPADGSYYNLLVEGFRAGHLNINREPPQQLARVPDPYNPAFNAAVVGPVNDLSYFKGKLYLYFGVTPALVLCWPWVAVTGHYLSDRAAVAVFFAVGLAVIASLLFDIRRRYFPGTNPWMVGLSVLSMGIAVGLNLSGNVYEVAIVCGFAFLMLALGAFWRALHEPQRRVFWLALASMAYGLAMGARPTLLFSTVILLIPVAEAYRETGGSVHRFGWLLPAAAATVPAMLIVLALMAYNQLRFGNPFEFGWHYQLNGRYDATKAHQFSPHYFWFNFRNYFLEPFEIRARFPFLHNAPALHIPSGYDTGSPGVGAAIWCSYPPAWLALALPLAWIGRPGKTISSLRRFAAALFFVLIIMALVLCLFFTAGSRYELDFLPVLLMLAIIGYLGAERAMASSSVRRRGTRAIWCFLLVCSIALSVLTNLEGHAESHYFRGNMFLSANRIDDAMTEYQKSLALWPDCQDAHDGLGNLLLNEGRLDEAIAQYQKALEFEPQSATARERYGDALFQKARFSDAMLEYQKAVDLKPDFAQAHENLGTCFAKAGQLDQAIHQYQQAAILQPYSMGAYYSLGNVLRLKGWAGEAETNYQKAIELEPGFIPAQVNLAEMLATSRDSAIRNADKAVILMENANRATNGNDPQVLRTLAIAYAETGQYSDAITTAKKALAIATAESNTGLIKRLEADIRSYQAPSPNRSAGH
jgi:tetratricopeptide (TPR) repeat protein